MDRQTHIWNIHAHILARALDDFEDAEWWFRPNGMNPAIWILGHLLRERKWCANLLGMEEPMTARDGLFDAGTKPEDLPGDLDGAALLGEFGQLHGRFVTHLEAMGPEDLAAGIEEEFPASPKTRQGANQFLLMHEGYHLGQLGALRVMLGRGSWMARP